MALVYVLKKEKPVNNILIGGKYPFWLFPNVLINPQIAECLLKKKHTKEKLNLDTVCPFLLLCPTYENV